VKKLNTLAMAKVADKRPKPAAPIYWSMYNISYVKFEKKSLLKK